MIVTYHVSVEEVIDYDVQAESTVQAAEIAVQAAYEEGLVTDQDFPVRVYIEDGVFYPVDVEMDIVPIFKGSAVNPLTL